MLTRHQDFVLFGGSGSQGYGFRFWCLGLGIGGSGF